MPYDDAGLEVVVNTVHMIDLAVKSDDYYTSPQHNKSFPSFEIVPGESIKTPGF